MKQLVLLFITSVIALCSLAQNVGIGTTSPLNKLHIAGGLRVDTLANSIDSGILRHDKNGVIYTLKFTGQATDVLRGDGTFGSGSAGASGWLLTGNSGIAPTAQFIGTTDQLPLQFRINNIKAGYIDSTGFNTSIGFRTLDAISTGTFNSAFGYKAFASNTTGNDNTAIGSNALRFNTAGTRNTRYGSRLM